MGRFFGKYDKDFRFFDCGLGGVPRRQRIVRCCGTHVLQHGTM